MADEIPDELYGLMVRDFDVGELIFDQDHQFNNIEQVHPEIVPEVRIDRDTVEIEPHMPSDKSADLVRDIAFFYDRCSSSGQASHGKSPQCRTPNIRPINPPCNVALVKIPESVAITARPQPRGRAYSAEYRPRLILVTLVWFRPNLAWSRALRGSMRPREFPRAGSATAEMTSPRSLSRMGCRSPRTRLEHNLLATVA
jgi:hypothetical protein